MFARSKFSVSAFLGVLWFSLQSVTFAGSFTNAKPMLAPRVLHTATLLQDGQVLVAGGMTTNRTLQPTAAAELYDPLSDNWTTTAPMASVRRAHTATLLPNAKVLVIGGNTGSAALSSAELYDPASGTWTNIAAMKIDRAFHAAILLRDGRVLVTGGRSGGNQGMTTPERTAELYDPTLETWTPTGSMKQPRMGHTATLLPDGRVIVTGDSSMMGLMGSAEIYAPSNGAWSAVGPLCNPSWGHTATLLPSGQVLVVGGGQPRPSLATAELFDAVTERWSVLVGQLHAARQAHTATLLADGNLLVTGGYELTNTVAVRVFSAELLDPVQGSWREVGSLTAARFSHTGTLLTNGNVLLVGGWGTNGVLASAELYVPPEPTGATNRRLHTLYSALPTLPPGAPPPKDPTRGEILLSNVNYQVSAFAWSVRTQMEEAHARATQPTYLGRSLSYWVSDVEILSSRWPTPLKDEAKAAIAHIGTNAIPFLVKWMEGNGDGLIEAFQILGPRARSAIPDLVRLVTNQTPQVSSAALQAQRPLTVPAHGPLMALGAIGPDALPALLNILTNSIVPGVRFGAVGALAQMGTNAAPAIPALLKYLDDENEMVVTAAVAALGTSGSGNHDVLAVLERVSQGPQLALRSTALDALENFGQQAVPAFVRALGDTNYGIASVAFHKLAFQSPEAITNSNVLAIAAARLQTQDAEWQEWAARLLRAIGQQANGQKPDFMVPISRRDSMLEDATNVLRRLAPSLLLDKPSR